ncbi:hypothetical protein OROGR_014713 [Orobanche gracilis]
MRRFIILLLVATFVIHVPTTTQTRSEDEGKIVVLTNNHTNYLSVRCFSFDDNFDVTHLPPGGQYKFRVRKRLIYPSSTMFNCSTNMGTFVAYKYSYGCNEDTHKTCDWRFDEDSAYLWEPLKNLGLGEWEAVDYSPNYESLNRGGVIKGYFAN